MRVSYFLKSERAGFRTWTLDDLPFALALWGDPEVTRLIDARGKLDENQVRERLLNEIATQALFEVQYWPVFLLEAGDFLGCCGLRPYKPDEQVYELGIHLRTPYWGKGHAADLSRTVMKYAFGQLNVASLFAGHNPRNHRSSRLLHKLGFRHTHDEYYAPTGLQHPSYLLTREEFDVDTAPRPLASRKGQPP
jgi:RimJ/RimL family protein N-acetyltransferase